MKTKITRDEFLNLKEILITSFNTAYDMLNQDSNIDRNAENYRELLDNF